MGLLLGVASIALYQSAYASTRGNPYPGPIVLPGIPPGPSLGCNPAGTSNETWVSGFNSLSHVSFRVNGRPAGTAQVSSLGAVLVTLTFGLGYVEVSGNPQVPIHSGTNYLVVAGHKMSGGTTYVVGLRMPFVVPVGTAQRCVTSPPTTSPTSSVSSSSTSSTIRRPKAPILTTSTRLNPTTLAKAIESPLQISPNKVILETSLLAAVLAAVLSAGALGSLWAGAGPDGGAAVAVAGGTPAPEGGGGTGAPEPTPEPTPEAPPAPPPTPGGGGGAPSGAPTTTRMTSAFVRPTTKPPPGGGS